MPDGETATGLPARPHRSQYDSVSARPATAGTLHANEHHNKDPGRQGRSLRGVWATPPSYTFSAATDMSRRGMPVEAEATPLSECENPQHRATTRPAWLEILRHPPGERGGEEPQRAGDDTQQPSGEQAIQALQARVGVGQRAAVRRQKGVLANVLNSTTTSTKNRSS